MTNIYLVIRPKDSVEVAILPRVEDGKFSFVNLTKGHICKCKFNSVEEAIEDMEKQIKQGKVIKYIKLD
jgi:hypothetical protein